MARKEFRELTVSENTNYGGRRAPMLRIQGLWLEELGFHTGDSVKVKCEDGKLIVVLDKERMEFEEAEKAFMESETKKLKARFEKEKEVIRAQFVAERKAGYMA